MVIERHVRHQQLSQNYTCQQSIRHIDQRQLLYSSTLGIVAWVFRVTYLRMNILLTNDDGIDARVWQAYGSLPNNSARFTSSRPCIVTRDVHIALQPILPLGLKSGASKVGRSMEHRQTVFGLR